MPLQLLSLLISLVSALSLSLDTLGQATSLGGYLALVNRDYVLAADYEPDDLVRPNVKATNGSAILMRSEAAAALEELFAAAKDEAGLTLYAASGYRSYGTQSAIFERKIKNTGSREKAQRLVAPPGASEHQLGLAMDVQCPDTLTLSSNFAQTDEGRWVEENAHRFGFIIRYKAEWKSMTGYNYEPWHIRYIGVAHATAVHMLNIPYETYYEQVIRLPEYVLTQGNPYLLAGAVQDLINGDESILALLPANAPDTDAALRRASQRYLPEDTSYQQAVWMGYPTPVPTPEPRVDTDTEEYSYSQMEGK